MIPHSIDELRSTVHEMLEETDKPDDDENLIDYGLNSLQIMELASEWQRSLPGLDFVSLGQTPTIEHWWELIQQEQNQ